MAPVNPLPFHFERDTFAFPNELIWEYRFDSATGQATNFRREPPPTYAHHCFVLIRSARQFLFHARFDPSQPVADAATYDRLIRAVVARNPRHISPPERRVVIAGYNGLREFSQGQEAALKAACGGAWQSYALRSHWRMVFPISRQHQASTVRGLMARVAAGGVPILHLVRFPQLTINHGALVINAADSGDKIQFTVYDPNVPEHPSQLSYERASRTFYFPRNHYWQGGRVDVIEIYRNWMY